MPPEQRDQTFDIEIAQEILDQLAVDETYYKQVEGTNFYHSANFHLVTPSTFQLPLTLLSNTPILAIQQSNEVVCLEPLQDRWPKKEEPLIEFGRSSSDSAIQLSRHVCLKSVRKP